MGLIASFVQMLFGGGHNVVKETVEAFRPNAEAADRRDAATQAEALHQFAAEFAQQRPGLFDRIVDGLNRLPRPALALGTLGLIAAAMIDPVWFASRMQGIALVPEPLWWLMGAVVSFYFGARSQVKTQDFQRSIASTMMLAGQVTKNVNALKALDGGQDVGAAPAEENAALADWKQQNGQ